MILIIIFTAHNVSTALAIVSFSYMNRKSVALYLLYSITCQLIFAHRDVNQSNRECTAKRNNSNKLASFRLQMTEIVSTKKKLNNLCACEKVEIQKKENVTLKNFFPNILVENSFKLFKKIIILLFTSYKLDIFSKYN